MKVGDYVRYRNIITKVIKIDRIKKIIPPDEFIDKEYYELSKGGTFKEYILKSSSNIIDLIEVGDYVNGSEVCKIYDNNHLDNPIKEVFCMGKDGFEGKLIYTNDDIKSIVTREQFESMKYKVGE